MSNAYPFHTEALIAPVDGRAVAAFNRERGRRRAPISQLIFAVLIGMMTLSVVFNWVDFLVKLVAAPDQLSESPLSMLVALLLATALVATGAYFFVKPLLRFARSDTGFRLHHFAAANAMQYVGEVENPALPGMIFRDGADRRSTDVMRGVQPRLVEFATFERTMGTGRSKYTDLWGYVAIRLDSPVPNIVLDAVGNYSLLGTSLAVPLVADQRLSLEGDFDRYFQLFCPRGYEADALYLFTPDIMSRFIEHAAELDVELVDDWLFLYSRRRLSTTDPATWAWLFSTVGALLTKLDQWARWRDERLLDDPVRGREVGDGVSGSGVSGDGASSSGVSSSGTDGIEAEAVSAGATAGAAVAAPSATSAALPLSDTTLRRPPPGVAEPGRRLRSPNTGWLGGAIVLGALGAIVLVNALMSTLK